MSDRLRLHRDLTIALPEHPDLVVSTFGRDQIPEIAELMIDAYRGTVDDEGENVQDAIDELARAADGAYGEPIPDAWLVARGDNGRADSAIVITRHHDAPFVSYVFTRKERTGAHLASGLVILVMEHLAAKGETTIALGVAADNPALHIYQRLGFVA